MRLFSLTLEAVTLRMAALHVSICSSKLWLLSLPQQKAFVDFCFLTSGDRRDLVGAFLEASFKLHFLVL